MPTTTHSQNAYPSSRATITASSSYIRPKKAKAHTPHPKLVPGEQSQGTQGMKQLSISLFLGVQELPPTYSVEMLILAHSWTHPDHRAKRGNFHWLSHVTPDKSICSRPCRITVGNLEMESSQRCLLSDKALRVDPSQQDCVSMTHRGRTQ